MQVDTSNNDVPVLRRAAMDSLARREHSFLELKIKLQRKYPEQVETVIEQVLSQLREEKLQSDERFTESYIRYRKSRGFAYLHIKSDLQSRGVSDALIDAWLHPDDEDWDCIADELVGRRLAGTAHLQFGSKEHRRLLRFLESRGFPAKSIRHALDHRFSPDR